MDFQGVVVILFWFVFFFAVVNHSLSRESTHALGSALLSCLCDIALVLLGVALPAFVVLNSLRAFCFGLARLIEWQELSWAGLALLPVRATHHLCFHAVVVCLPRWFCLSDVVRFCPCELERIEQQVALRKGTADISVASILRRWSVSAGDRCFHCPSNL